jgi:hypothetical protein
VAAFDERAAAWWLEQRAAAGAGRQPAELVAEMRAELHPLERLRRALAGHFELHELERCAYLYRWELGEELRLEEERLIADGRLPAVGVRLVGRRRESAGS